MKSGISTKIRYNINNDVVVCIIEIKESNIWRYIWHMECAAHEVGIATRILPNPKEFKGVARLKNDDEHNLALAKEIARKKAMRKMYKIYHNYMALAAEYFGMAWGRYLDTAIELADKANDIDNEIVKLTSKTSQS